MGQKEPFSDTGISHAKCPDCIKKQKQGLEKLEHSKHSRSETPAEMAERVKRLHQYLQWAF